MSYHPLAQFIDEILVIFESLGFEIAEGPEIEDEWHNFDGLRVPADHPSRDVQDTFWLDSKHPLRTHTTSVDLRLMEGEKPPARFIIPGRCFRHEATDQHHEAQFYQIDGFAIDKDISFADLMGTLEFLIKRLYGKQVELRFVPHHYPFVEPGLDLHIRQKGQEEWLEVLGAGILHPEVLKNMRVDPTKWQGFAFGMGVDRLMMLYYGIDDIRLSYVNDFRFLKQFKP